MSNEQHGKDAKSPVEVRYASERQKMVAQIRAMALEIGESESASLISPGVLAVMSRVPRHCFVPEADQYSAYFNHPLPIGHGQTISQPYIVALMTDLLAPGKQHTVLEVGTGSGYQAAVLSEMAAKVYTVEIVEPLATAAAKVLHDLKYDNVEVRAGDGSQGWPEHAPYDGIIVTAAAEHVPQPLLDQLKPGGRLVIPVGGQFNIQQLLLITKDLDGTLHRKNIEAVRFVPLTGKY